MLQYQSESTVELAKALIQVQRTLQPAYRDATNPFTRSSYATLNSIMTACHDALLSNSIWMTQYPVPAEPGYLGLVTKLTHAESGQWQSSLAVVPLPKADPQGLGSAMTYCRRYALSAMLGIVTEDDDGEGAKVNTRTGKAGRPGKPDGQSKTSQPTPETPNPSRFAPSQGTKSEAPPHTSQLALPHIDGITYQHLVSQDGRPCIIATGQTQPKKQLLMASGFKWNGERKIWWKYADVA